MAARDAVLRIGVDSSGLTAGLATAGGKLRTWGKKVSTELRGVFRGAFSGLMDIGGMGGVAGLAFATKNVFDFEKRLVRLKIASRSTAVDMGHLRAAIHATAVTHGVDAAGLLGGTEKYVELTGDINSARESLKAFAQINAATGATFEDIATVSAALGQNFKVLPKDMEKAFSVMVTQGKEGAVEFKDIAGLIQGLTPMFANFGTTGVPGVAKLSAALQIARQGFGTAAEGATGLEAVMTALTDSTTIKKLEKAGIKVFDVDEKGKAHLRDMMSLVFETYEKVGGDPRKIADIFGRKEAVKTVTKMGQLGRDPYENLVTKGMASNEVLKDSAEYTASFAGKLASAKGRLDAMFSDALVKHIDTFVKLFEKLVAAIAYVVEHPGAIAALWAGMKLGGMGGGLGGGLGGGAIGLGGALLGGGGAAGGVAAGGVATGAAGAASNAVGVLKGGLVGYAVAKTLGEDLPDYSQAIITATGALAGMPGTIGLIGKAVLAGQAAILGVAKWKAAELQEKEDQTVKSQYGEFAMDRAKELVTAKQVNRAGEATRYATTKKGYRDPKTGKWMNEGLDEKQREAAVSLLNQAVKGGSATVDKATGSMTFDPAKMRKQLEAQGNLDVQQIEELVGATTVAHSQRALGGDAEVRRRTGGVDFGPGPTVPEGPGIGERMITGAKDLAATAWANFAAPAPANEMPTVFHGGGRSTSVVPTASQQNAAAARAELGDITFTIKGTDMLTKAIAESMAQDPNQRRH